MNTKNFCEKLNIDIFDIDKNIFKIVHNEGGIVNLYKKTKMINKKLIILNNEMKLKYVNIFEFISVYRKVLIQTIFDSYVKKLIKMKEYDNFYKTVPAKHHKYILSLYATGSSSLLSDYDVQILGPGNYYIYQCILDNLQQFLVKTSGANKLFIHEYLNCNFYLSPHMIMNNFNYDRIQKILGSNKIFKIKEVYPKCHQIIIIPIEKNLLRLEFLSLKRKIKNFKYNEKFNTELLKNIKIIDNFLYGTHHDNLINNSTDMFKYLIKCSQMSTDSFHTISTVCIIVYILQLENKHLVKIISAESALISTMENIIDMKIEYENMVRKKFNTPENLSSLRKQGFRILYSLKIYCYKNKNTKLKKFLKHYNLLKKYYYYNKEKKINPQDYKIIIDLLCLKGNKIELFGNQNNLVQSCMKECELIFEKKKTKKKPFSLKSILF